MAEANWTMSSLSFAAKLVDPPPAGVAEVLHVPLKNFRRLLVVLGYGGTMLYHV